MKKIRIFLILLLAAALAMPAAFAEVPAEAEAEGLDYLARELEASSAMLLQTGEDVEDIYSELH